LRVMAGNVDEKLAELVDSMLDRDPDARPQSAAEARRLLLDVCPPDDEGFWALVRSDVEFGDAPTRRQPSMGAIPQLPIADSGPAPLSNTTQKATMPARSRASSVFLALPLLVGGLLGAWFVWSGPTPPPPVPVIESATQPVARTAPPPPVAAVETPPSEP